MQDDEYRNLIKSAIKAKKPVRWLLTFISVAATIVIVLSEMKNDYAYDRFIVIGLSLIYCMSLYEGIIKNILEYLDIAFYRLVKFEGIVVGSGAYHTYRTAPAPDSMWIIEVKGKKRELYVYDPLTAYIRRTHRPK